jgi:predicted DNA-binding protein
MTVIAELPESKELRTERITIAITTEISDKLKKLAKKRYLTKSTLAQMIIEQNLAQYE